MFTLADHRLNLVLRLPPLERTVCHGYATGCTCVACSDREAEPIEAPAQPRQPWELAA